MKEYDGKPFEKYSEHDELGRCGPAEPLSGNDIETQDDWEVWQRFINGEGG